LLCLIWEEKNILLKGKEAAMSAEGKKEHGHDFATSKEKKSIYVQRKVSARKRKRKGVLKRNGDKERGGNPVS